MKIISLLFSTALVLGAYVSNAQDLYFTTTGSCASYITYNNWDSHQADSVYLIERANQTVVVDGDADAAYGKAHTGILNNIMNESKVGNEMNLSNYPQSETDLYTTFKALWTENGVYMFIEVKDDMVRYQNPDYQWENDAIEFFFAKAPGEGKIQIIIPAMVGTTNPSKPAALEFESGSAIGSNEGYNVFGYDDWDESTFFWAIKKTATGYNMEVYMEKDIVTNGNIETNFGEGKMFAGDINIDEADEKLNDNALFVREAIIGMMGNSLHEYATSDNYGWFKMVDTPVTTGVNSISKPLALNAYYNSTGKQILVQNTSVASVTLYNIAGQVMSSKYINGNISVSHLEKGMYILSAKDLNGNRLASQKITIY